jgi:hypothetical protein
MREATHGNLGHAGVGERPEDMVVGGGASARSVRSPSIVGVLPVRNGVQSVVIGDPFLDPGEKLVLAVETPIGGVRLILRTITFVRHHLDERYADLARNVVGSTAFLGSEAGGDAEESQHVAGTKYPCREGKEQRGVDASGKSNSQPSDSREAGRDRRYAAFYRPVVARTEWDHLREPHSRLTFQLLVQSTIISIDTNAAY